MDFERGLNAAIKRLRYALADDTEAPRFVETVPRRGYRFIATDQLQPTAASPARLPLPVATARQETDREGIPQVSRPGPRRLGAFALAAAVGLMSAAITYWWLSGPPVPRVIRSVQITASGRVEPWGGIVTDGARLYFLEREGDHWNLVQTSAAGGEAQPVSAPFRNTRILDISPDQSEFLLARFVVRGAEMPLWVAPVAGGSPRRVGEITATDAIWCPDGKTILYVKGSDLYLVDRDGTNPRKLASTPGVPGSLAWSPDRRKLRFDVADPDRAAALLWEVAADGTGLHRLLPGWSSPPAQSECCGRWTPDGRYFLFESNRGGTNNVWALAETQTFLRRRSQLPVQLTYGPTQFGAAVPSKDGKRIFVIGGQPRPELVEYGLKSGQFSPYLPGIRAWSVSFSHDNDWMAYILSPEGTLWRSKPNGTSRQQLTFPPYQPVDPRWSPDGKQLAFWTAPSSGELTKFYLISAEGGNPREVAPEWHAKARPNWSPDGGSLVFEVTGGGSGVPPVADALYTINLKTNEVSRLPSSEGFIEPRWSPEGRYIAAVGEKQSKLMLFDLEAQRWTQVAQGSLLTALTWSRNGQTLYFQDLVEAGQPLYRLRISDHKRERVTGCEKLLQEGVLRCAMVALAPDGFPVFQVLRSLADIYALELDLP